MKTGKILFACISIFLIFSLTVPLPQNTVAALSDENSRQTEKITLSDGTDTGVELSKINLSGSTYGNDIEVNAAEFDLSNTNLSVNVINSGDNIVGTATLGNAVREYNSEHSGQTVLAAVNGDLWMTAVHSGPTVTKAVLKVTRGVLMIGGEIWASQQIDQENFGATNAEKNTPAGNKAAFGVTYANQPLVGSPDIKISISVNDKKIAADGLNRLPAQDALIVYNHRVSSSNYALNDAYEIELEVDEDSAFKHGSSISARVKAIYPAGSETRPAIGEKTIVITARGSKIAAVNGVFSVGDSVVLTAEITDRMGNTELWQNVKDAIGGHMQPIIDGKPAIVNGDTTAYPSSFVGFKDDGTVAFVTVTSAKDNSRAALRFCDAYKFCKEMGYNSAFYLDGGGSTTFLSLENGSYTVRNKCSDGAPREVVNGIGVVWNDTPVCESQGSLGYIKLSVDLSHIPATYIDGALLSELVTSPNNLEISYDETQKALRMKTTTRTNDPFALLNFGALQSASADEYKYLVFKVKTDHTQTTNFVLYYATGEDSGSIQSRTKTFSVKKGMNKWSYIIVDMSKLSDWKGNINSMRLDIFDSVYTAAGKSMYIGAIVLCRTAEEAKLVESGWAPEGSVTDYLEYLNRLDPSYKPTETEPEPTETEPEESETPSESASEIPSDTATEAPNETDSPQTASGGCSCNDSAAISLFAVLLLFGFFKKRS